MSCLVLTWVKVLLTNSHASVCNTYGILLYTLKQKTLFNLIIKKISSSTPPALLCHSLLRVEDGSKDRRKTPHEPLSIRDRERERRSLDACLEAER
jgi:hypothetical protein